MLLRDNKFGLYEYKMDHSRYEGCLRVLNEVFVNALVSYR